MSDHSREIVSLPSKVEGHNENSSAEVIKHVNSKRQKQLENIRKELDLNLTQINSNTNEFMHLLAKQFKEHLLNTKEFIKNIVNERIKLLINQPEKLDEKTFEETRKLIWKINELRIKQVADFYNNLKAAEDSRNENFKVLFKETYQKLLNNYYLIPYEVEEQFQMEVSRTNEMTLNNYNAFAELQNDIKQELIDAVRLLMIELDELKEQWQENYKKINEGEKGDEDKTKSVEEAAEKGNAIWAKNVQVTVDHLDITARKLVVLYKSAILKIFHRFFKELANITDDKSDIIAAPTLANNTELMEALEDLSRDYECEIEELQELWEGVIDYMKSHISSTYTFLELVSHLWDDHFNRLSEAQSLVLKDIEKSIRENDKSSKVSEEQMNITIDKLRQSSSIQEMDENLQAAKKLLNSIEALQTKQNKEELKTINKYYKLVDLEIGVLIAELQRFVHENVKYERVEGNEEFDFKHKLIPRQISLTRYQVEAVHNWMFGLWESIKLYLTHCREELNIEADQWIKSIAEKVNKRLEIRLAVHKPKFERIKVDIYDKRKQEIEKHDEDFRKFENEIEEILKIKIEEIHSLNIKQDKVLEDFKKSLQELTSKLENSKDFSGADCLMRCMNIIKKNAEDEMKKICEQVQKICEDVKVDIDRLKFFYLTSVKLFCDGGNYSSTEVKNVNKKVLSLEISVPKRILQILQEAEMVALNRSQNIDTDCTTFSNKVVDYKNQFQFNDTILSKIETLRRILRCHHSDFRYKNHKLFHEMEEFLKFCNVNMSNQAKVLKIVEDFNEIEKNCLTLHNAYVTGDNNNWHESCMSLIRHSWKDIEEFAKTFYEKNPNAESDFKEFMNTVQIKMESYKRQCQLNWFDLIQNFIGEILALLKFFKSYYNNFINDHLNKVCIEFGQHCDDILEKLAKQRVSTKRRFNNLLTSNTSNWNTFEKMLEDLHNDCKKSFSTFIETNVETIRNEYVEIREELCVINSTIGKINDKNITEMCSTLLCEFERELDSIKVVKEIKEKMGLETEPTSGYSSSLGGSTSLMAFNKIESEDIIKGINNQLKKLKTTLETTLQDDTADEGNKIFIKRTDRLRRDQENAINELEKAKNLPTELYGEQLNTFSIKMPLL